MADSKKRGGGETVTDTSSHTTPQPDQDRGLSGGGDKSAVKQQAQAAAAEGNGGGESADILTGRVVERDKPTRQVPSLEGLGVQTPLTVVEEDVYEKFYMRGSDRPLYRLAFRRGQVVETPEYELVTGGKTDEVTRSHAVVGDVRQMVNGSESVAGGVVTRD